jgi:hypothetical protein
VQDASAQCKNCHKDVASTAQHSTHAAANVGCVDCHMGVRAEGNYDPHAGPNHTGNATLETCNACHSTQMHASTGVPITVEPTPATPGPLSAGLIDTSPQAPGPLGYILISVLVGLAFGFVLAPMIERSSRRRKGGK